MDVIATGFVVDAVAEVIRISSSEIQPPPSITQGSTAQECITGVINHAERLLIALDLNRMFSDEGKAVFETLECPCPDVMMQIGSLS